eukprot:TRINITY_DN9735_c0_g1_i11.p1 TRINITY_DN9735_c0_g1~~TRINITY_DN9735_c0_g1_i11.p1  ORF type:complete len:950 (+),score=272.28 TRINITY_DN9735_c0_g1_i11:48-2897(+)
MKQSEQQFKRFSSIDRVVGSPQFPPKPTSISPGRAIPGNFQSNDTREEDLFDRMMPLKEQLQGKTHLTEREKRLMLREIERKKRLAGASNPEYNPYGRESDANNMGYERLEDYSNPLRMQARDEYGFPPNNPSHDIYSEPVNLGQQNNLLTNDRHNREEVGFPNILGEMHERKRKKKEEEREFFRQECARLQRVSKNEANTNLPISYTDDKAKEIEEKKKKQLLYREQLEKQLKEKNKMDKAADEIFSRITKGSKPVEERVPNNQMGNFPLPRNAWSEERYANELNPQIPLKNQPYTNPYYPVPEPYSNFEFAYNPSYAYNPNPNFQVQNERTYMPEMNPSYELYRQEDYAGEEAANPDIGHKPTAKMSSAKNSSERQKKEEYRKFLERQMNEKKDKRRQEKETTPQQVEVLKHADTVLSEEEAEKQRKLYLQQYMHEELKKQMEEKERRKLVEKQRKKEEELKEMERLKREQEEMKRLSEYKGSPTLAVQKKLKELQPSADNPIARFNGSVIPDASPHKPTSHAENQSAQNSPAKVSLSPVKERSVERLDVRAKKEANSSQTIQRFDNIRRSRESQVNPNPLPYPMPQNMPVLENSVDDNLIEEYKRQIEKLKSENLLAKEEASIFRERLISEREIRLNHLLSQLSSAQPLAASAETPPEEMSASGHKRDDAECIAQLMRSELKYSPPENFELEQSLESETKLVKALERNDLYETWNRVEVPKKQEVSVQTSVKGKLIEESKTKGIPEVFRDKYRKKDRRRALEDAKKYAQMRPIGSIPEELEEDKHKNECKEEYVEELELEESDSQSQDVQKQKYPRHDESESGVILGISKADTPKHKPELPAAHPQSHKEAVSEEIEEGYSEIEESLMEPGLNAKLEKLGESSAATSNKKVKDSGSVKLARLSGAKELGVKEAAQDNARRSNLSRKFPVECEVEDVLDEFKIYDEP